MDDGEIRNLIALLAQHADIGTVEDYVALFTPDAEWVMPAIPQSGLAASTRRGRAEIEAGVRERRASGVQGPGTHTAHVVTSTIVQFVGAAPPDRAIAESIWLFVLDTGSNPRVTGFGRYRDTVARTADGWRLARREITLG
jgi:3-phenylpropionate/cinnamic acid dioxygenase small subunit